ncbi:hypothetical protein [uncultured Desulfovibrio sp.]|uniref:hypothetical protein n=1 Tax=uncultured Desulfovibrio sp. TaxID=167968 RepID=UPI002625AE97|nr:hypothetical protein [uncultured Desulfovibrio sp.]
MGDGIEIKHNAEKLVSDFRRDGLLDGFRLGSSRVRVATSRAINRTLEHMRTLISKDIRAIYYVKKKDLDAGIKIKRAHTGKNQSGSITFSNRHSLPLSQFGARQGKSYVSVKVLKANRARRIRPGGVHNIAATAKGRAAVWIAKGHVMARAEGDNTALALYGPSFMSFFTFEGRDAALQGEMDAMLQQRLVHELSWVSKQSNLTNFGRGK